MAQGRFESERLELIKLARRHTPGSEARLEKFLEEHPSDVELLELWVNWQLRENAPAEVLEPRLNQWCELRPNDSPPFRTRAAWHAKNGRPEEAIADGLRALEGAPDDQTTRRMVAVAAAEAGQYDVAIRECKRLYESSDPSQREIGVMLVKAYLLANEPSQAAEVLDECFPADAGDDDGAALRAQVFQSAGRHADAVPLLRSLADESAIYREFALFRLSQSLTALGRDDEARETLGQLERVKARTRAIVDAAQRPDDLAQQLRAAEILLEDGRTDEAVGVLEQAVRRFGREPSLARNLARAYRAAGRLELAAEWETAGEP